MFVVKLDTKKLDALTRETPLKAKEIIRSSSFQIEGWAKERVPRDPKRPPKNPKIPVTGALRNSINTEIINSGFTGIVSDGVEYGIYQELGTSRIPARPWLVPAVERMAKEWIAKWKDLIK
jgi:hypothetical protein